MFLMSDLFLNSLKEKLLNTLVYMPPEYLNTKTKLEFVYFFPLMKFMILV